MVAVEEPTKTDQISCSQLTNVGSAYKTTAPVSYLTVWPVVNHARARNTRILVVAGMTTLVCGSEEWPKKIEELKQILDRYVQKSLTLRNRLNLVNKYTRIEIVQRPLSSQYIAIIAPVVLVLR